MRVRFVGVSLDGFPSFGVCRMNTFFNEDFVRSVEFASHTRELIKNAARTGTIRGARGRIAKAHSLGD